MPYLSLTGIKMKVFFPLLSIVDITTTPTWLKILKVFRAILLPFIAA